MQNKEENTNKIIPDELKEVITRSLLFFPELKNVPIEFRIKKSIKGSFMQAQPVISSMLFNKNPRKYKINISNFLIIEEDVMNLQEIPKDVLLGWIGHELGHIMDYLPRSNFNMFLFAIRYLFSKKFMAGAERRADIFAINKGLSSYLIMSKNYILEHTSLPENYKKKIRRYYLSPEEVMMYLEGELGPVN